MRKALYDRLKMKVKIEQKELKQKDEDLKAFFGQLSITDPRDFDKKLISMNKDGPDGITFD